MPPRDLIVRTMGVLLALIGAWAAGCERAGPAGHSGAPAGESAEIAPRLAILSPGLAITLVELGYERHIVGRHGFDIALEHADPPVPVVGDQFGIDYERLIAARPGVVILEQTASGPPDRLVELCDQRSMQLLVLPALSLSDIRASIVALDAVVRARNAPAEHTLSPRAGELLDAWDRVLGSREQSGAQASEQENAPGATGAEGASRLGRTLSVVSTSPVGVTGPGSFSNEIIYAIGAHPVPASGSAYQQLSLEDVIALAPDTIILYATGDEHTPEAELLGPLADAPLDAVRAGRVIVVRERWALTPSVKLTETAHTILDAAQTLDPVAQPGEGQP